LGWGATATRQERAYSSQPKRNKKTERFSANFKRAPKVKMIRRVADQKRTNKGEGEMTAGGGGWEKPNHDRLIGGV